MESNSEDQELALMLAQEAPRTAFQDVGATPPTKRGPGRPKGSKNRPVAYIDDGTFHGVFARDRGEGRGVRVAGPKPGDLSKLNHNDVALRVHQIASTAENKVFGGPQVHMQIKERKPGLSSLGIPSILLDSGDPEYARCIRLAQAYKRSRTKELFLAHGYVSAGVSSLLVASSLALAASRFLYQNCCSPDLLEQSKLSVPSVLKMASSLGDSSRQNELSAWELCARESVIRKRNADGNQNVPWLVNGTDGQEKRKPGRPRKVELVQQLVETTVEDPNG